MLTETLLVLTKVAMLTFVVGSMLAMGLTLTVRQIVGAWRDLRVVSLLVVVNFVVVPGVAFGFAQIVPVEADAATALVLIGCAAGAPFLPKLAQQAHGDVPLAVGSMVLLMLLTVLYAPLVVPVLVSGADVSAWDIASSLVLFMLVPMLVGLAVRARYPDLAGTLAPPASQASSTALLLGVGSAILVTWRDIVGSTGSGIFVGVVVVVAVGLVAGAAIAARGPAPKRDVLALATAQRNISAALVVATQLGGDVLVYALVGAICIPVVLMVVAGEIGRRHPSGQADPDTTSARARG